MKLKDTVDLMLSDDLKDRLKKELVRLQRYCLESVCGKDFDE